MNLIVSGFLQMMTFLLDFMVSQKNFFNFFIPIILDIFLSDYFELRNCFIEIVFIQRYISTFILFEQLRYFVILLIIFNEISE